MKYVVRPSTKFKKDLKRVRSRGYNLARLEQVISMLAEGVQLPESNRDHNLTGDFAGYRECHIAPDWLLVYRFENETLYLLLTRTGTHSDIFDE